MSLLIVAALFGTLLLINLPAWHYAFFHWPEQFRKLPMSSKELRRRKKEFYDSLARNNPRL
jgi:hypothetical protein